MPAFKTNVYTEVTDYERRAAEKFGCKLGVDSKTVEKLLIMNEKGGIGEDGKPHLACLCKVNTFCPCNEAPAEIEKEGHCYCNLFKKA